MQRRLVSGVIMLVAGTAVLAGCGGDDPQSEAPIGAVVRSERMDALNLAVVTDDGELGTLVGTLVNQADAPDTLQGVGVETEHDPVEAVLLQGAVPLPPDERVRLATDQRVVLRGDLREGLFVELTLAFDGSRTLTTLVPVEPATGPYEDVEIPDPEDLPAA